MATGFFEELNSNVMIILNRLTTSQNLLKYVSLQEFDPFNESDISDPSSILFENIFPFFKIPESEDSMVSFINVVFGDTVPYDNSRFRTEELLIYIGCHIDKWQVRGGLRPYFLKHEIDKLLNRADIPEISYDYVKFKRSSPMNFGNRFYGYVLKYQLSNNSNLICGE